jgi:hypothetical protein
MSEILIGVLAGIAAAPAWIITNLFVDFLFLPVIRRHSDQLNAAMMARPAMNLFILVADVVFWGALFGAGYGLLYGSLNRFAVGGGILWGLFMFIAFSRSIIESTLWTKVPREMNLFWFIEGLVGLVAWGAVLGILFDRWIH